MHAKKKKKKTKAARLHHTQHHFCPKRNRLPEKPRD